MDGNIFLPHHIATTQLFFLKKTLEKFFFLIFPTETRATLGAEPLFLRAQLGRFFAAQQKHMSDPDREEFGKKKCSVVTSLCVLAISPS